MKPRLLPALLVILFSAACNGTFEVGLEHPLTDTASPLVLPTTSMLPFVSPTPLASPTPEVLNETPVPTDTSAAQTVTIFLIAINDNGKGGQLVGCGDSAIPVQVEIPPTQGVMKAALGKLLSIKDQNYGQSGLYNALYQSSLQVGSINIAAGKASVYLTGTLTMGGECDNPRIKAQLELTVLQFPTVTEADIFINGKPLADVLSLK